MSGRLLGAAVADGLRAFARGRGLTLAAVVVIALTFSVSAMALLAAESLSAAVSTWGRPDTLRVYLEPTTPAEVGRVVAGSVRRLDGVTAAVLVPPDAIRARFVQAFPEMADVVDFYESSPFHPEIEVEMLPGIAEARRETLFDQIRKEESVVAVLGDHLWVNRVRALAAGVRRAGQYTGLFFALVAGLVVSGVVRLSLAARRDEIATMAVVGASRSFIVGPFLVEGVLLSAAGSALSVVVAWGLFRLFAGMTDGHPILGFLTLASLPAAAASGLVAAACLAGLLGAAWSVRRALRTE